MRNIVLFGEHDKGTGLAFHPSTRSGKILINILAELHLFCKLDNVFLSDGSKRDLRTICADYDIIIALGRKAEAELKSQGVNATYLPHPANRKGTKELKSGLEGLLK